MADTPDVKHLALTDDQLRTALLTLFKREIRDLYVVESYAMTSTGKFIVKLKKKPL